MTPSQRADKPNAAVFGAAIQGARNEQQDAFRVKWLEQEGGWLLVLADGMGGHACGALASRLAADAFLSSFLDQRSVSSSLSDSFDNSLRAANEAIAAALTEHRGAAEGMGTTLVAAYLSPGSVSWISVGDSPIWLYRAGQIVRLNEDHSLRQLGVGPHQSNMLQSAVVGSQIPMIDRHAEPLSLQKDDIVLLSSDGILTLDESQIAATIRSAKTGEPELLAWLLLHAVEDKAKTHQDNCTLIVCKPSLMREDPEVVPGNGRAAYSRTRLIVVGSLVFSVLAAGLAWLYFSRF
jgi:protein phosphatase